MYGICIPLEEEKTENRRFHVTKENWRRVEEMWRCQPPTTLAFVVNDDDNLKSTTVFNCMAIIFMCMCVYVTMVHQ